MTALLTQCPHCQTSFRVSTAQMNAAHGLVRCGSCLGVFSAGDNEIRVRTPDGYLVEEIDPDDDTEQSFSEESDDSATETAELPDEDLPLPVEVADEFADDPPADIDPAINEPTNTETTDIEPVDNEEPEEYAEEDPLSVQDEDDDESLFEIAPPAAPQALIALPDDEEADFSGEHTDEADDEIHDETGHDPTPWHGDPVITLGDMRLDELEDGYEDESKSDLVETREPQAPVEYEDEPQSHEEYVEKEGYEEEYAAEAHNESHRDGQPNEYREPEPAPVASPRYSPSAAETITAAPEKHNLHRRLSVLADDEFDPVDDDQLDTLDSLPVTITHGSTLRGQLVQSVLVLLSLLLLFALPLPWLYAERDTLATHPRFAFMAPLACKLFTCTPAATLDLGSIYSQQLLVRSHPRYQDALEVSFIFRNDTTLPRPFPLVELAFSDLSNNLLANRLFKPEEYLPAELRQLSEMPAQSTVQVTLELQDPGKEAVNYTVKLHPPTP